MKDLLKNLLIGMIATKSPQAAKIYDKYQKYAVPLIRARRYYGHNKRKGLDTQTALLAAAHDADVPVHLLVDYLKDKTGDFGEIAIDSLAGTSFDSTKTNYRANFK